MSTKIYDGLIATDDDVFRVASRIRGVLEHVYLKKYGEIFRKLRELPEGSTWADAPRGMFKFKNDADKNAVIHPHTLDFQLCQKIKELNESRTWTFSDADIMYEVVILPNMVDGNPLVMVFGSDANEYIELLKNAGVVKEYGYWNNSDELEGVTEEEWAERKLAWSSVYENAPIEVGLSISSPSDMQCAISVMAKWTDPDE